ncbi:MAG: indole-3-glycerol phosphate synthase TrpC [Rickettsiales bacterium]|jgi:indole-3-glycerol phosphate synthase|nr:indole-3-glycerol phosphate synthase TrpC [Rickettsiales bacterium]
MAVSLQEICARKIEHINARRALMPLIRLEELARKQPPVRGFEKALRSKVASGGVALIAELKKASPSKGLIRADFVPSELAKAYEVGGATCLSVLTDEPYFQGRDEYLASARNACALPALRKDFMIDPYQIAESRALGADCILLIMAALSDAQAAELEAVALSFSMDVLIEVHDEEELSRALKFLRSKLIGVNNRNLKTMQVELATSELLAAHIPPDILRVCESGIASHDDISRMRSSGFSVFLVGESLMRQNDVAASTKRLLGETHD